MDMISGVVWSGAGSENDKWHASDANTMFQSPQS